MTHSASEEINCGLCELTKKVSIYGDKHLFQLHVHCDKCSAEAEDASLCSICRHMRLPHLAACCSGMYERLNMGSLEEVKERSLTCRFCRFVRDLLIKKTHVLGQRHLDLDFVHMEVLVVMVINEPHLEITLHPLIPGESSVYVSTWTRAPDGGLRARKDGPPSPPPVFPGLIDWELVRSWLSSASEQTPTEEWPRGLKLIDVGKGVVVKAPARCRYVSLSYVWGGAGNTKVSSTGIISRDGLPRTIQDAMIACVRLKVHYLWVDQICINQSDSKEVEEQVNQMHRIYSNATCTLVALAGENADYGLPGVTQPRKWKFSEIEVGNLLLTDVAPGFDILLQASKWLTRGWTFQELVFSSTLLFFAESGVHFLDRQLTEPAIPLTSEAYSITNDLSPIPRISLYQKMLEKYTERCLTYESDILRAFSATMQAAHGNATYQGLPLGHIDRAVLWHPKPSDVYEYRDGFPSWSWACHIGPIDHLAFWGGLAIWATPQRAQFTIEVVLCGPVRGLRWGERWGIPCTDINEALVAHLTVVWLAGCIKKPFPIRIEGDVLRSLWQRWQTYDAYYDDAFGHYKVDDIFPLQDRQTACGTDGRLLVHAQVAYFSIKPINRSFYIFDARNHIAGLVKGPIISVRGLQKAEFLALSVGDNNRITDILLDYFARSYGANIESAEDYRRYFLDNESSLPEPSGLLSKVTAIKLNVMLITRNPETNVARRLGVGQIFLNKWVDANPRFKSVVLE